MAEKTNFLVQKNRGMTTRVYYTSQTETASKSIIPWGPGGYSMSKQGDHLFCSHISFSYFLWISEQTISFPYTALTEWYYNPEGVSLRAQYEPIFKYTSG